MQKWIVIIIVCCIYTIVMSPIAKAIKRKVDNKGLVFIIEFAISIGILMALYAIASSLGYPAL